MIRVHRDASWWSLRSSGVAGLIGWRACGRWVHLGRWVHRCVHWGSLGSSFVVGFIGECGRGRRG